jgi:hypothetical protein
MMNPRLLLVIALGCNTCSGLYADSGSLSLCTVLQSAAEYSRKVVRVRGILAVGAEQAVLYDPGCSRAASDADVAVTPKFKRNRPLDGLLKQDRRAWVIVEGTFYGPELAQIDPKLPPWMKDKLKGTMSRYGHLGSYSTMIEVTKIIAVEAVPPNTPWE